MQDWVRWDAVLCYLCLVLELDVLFYAPHIPLVWKDVKTALGKVVFFLVLMTLVGQFDGGIWVQSRVNYVISCNLASGHSTTPKFGGYYSIPSSGYSWPQKVHYFFTKEDFRLGQRPELARRVSFCTVMRYIGAKKKEVYQMYVCTCSFPPSMMS